MNIRKIISLVVLVLSILSFNAQTEGLPVKTIDGVEYYQYEVEKGNTLYSISKKFDISLNKLVSANPEAEKGLSIGDVINIPVKEGDKAQEKDATAIRQDTAKFIYHSVQQGETLYSIARLYGTKQDTLLKVNPEFATYLPANATVKVPKTNEAIVNEEVVPVEKLPKHPLASESDSLIQHKVEKGETLYSLSKKYNIPQEKIFALNPSIEENGLKKGDKIIIALPRKKPVTAQVSDSIVPFKTTELNPINGTLNVAVFVPLMLEEYKAEREKCLTKVCPVFKPTLLSLNYIHGIEFALDSLKKLGVDVNLYVYDTSKDSTRVRKTLQRKEFENMHLIFAPFFEHTLAPVLAFAKQKGVFVVNAVPQHGDVLKNNPTVVNTLASTETQIEQLGAYVAQHHANDNVLVIKNNLSKDTYCSSFQKHYKASCAAIDTLSLDTARQSYMNNGLTHLKSLLKKDQKNIIVVPSKDVRYVSEFLTKLNALANQSSLLAYDITVFGLGDWLAFNNIDFNYLSRFNTRFVKPSFIDYNNPKIQTFSLNYRERYNYDPNRYTFAAYDAALYHIYMLYANSNNIKQNYSSTTHHGAHINYHFSSNENNGFENKAVVVVGFENDQLVKLD